MPSGDVRVRCQPDGREGDPAWAAWGWEEGRSARWSRVRTGSAALLPEPVLGLGGDDGRLDAALHAEFGQQP